METRLLFSFSLAIALLYFFACLTPVVRLDDGISHSDLDFKDGSPIGLIVLLFGFTGGNNGLPWTANIVLVFGLNCLWARRFRSALALGVVANLLGLTTWWVLRHCSLLIGYYLWQASLLVLAVGAAVLLVHNKGRRCGSPRGSPRSSSQSA